MLALTIIALIAIVVSTALIIQLQADGVWTSLKLLLAGSRNLSANKSLKKGRCHK